MALSSLGPPHKAFAAVVTATPTPTVVSAYLAGMGNAKTIVVGRTLQFTAHVSYSDGSLGQLPDERGNSVTWWDTSNHAIATISSGGSVTAVGAGTVNIEAKIGALKAAPRRVTIIDAVVPAVAQQPTVACSANPSIINQGGTTAITATGGSAQNLPLTYSYSASAGSIGGTASTATLQTSGVSAGTLTVTCTADQQGGGTASATTNVILQSVAGEQAFTNFQFTDSVGVNLHLAFAGTIYQTQFPQIMQSMIALGITHYRDGLNQYALPFQYQNAEALGKAGMKADWLMDIHSSASIINSAYLNAPDATAGFEGPNEDDADVGFNLSNFMQLLNNTVRGNSATAAMPIIGPSFVQVSSFATQGNLNSLINSGNMHDYFGTFNPETGPYGGHFYNCGGYGSIQFNICLAQMVGVGEPVTSTETGYQSGTGLSDAIIGRYELRTLFEGLSLGVPRTYIYEMIDDASGNWGLITANFLPRPDYTAIQNVLALLKDVNFLQPGKLDYTLTGEMQNVNQVLLQKSNGTFYVAIWLAVPGADPANPSSAFNVAPQNVTLTSNTPIGATTTYVLDDSGNMTSTAGELTNGSMPIEATDRITIIALSLGQSH
jgi:Bacterial Ig-like domain (group 2)